MTQHIREYLERRKTNLNQKPYRPIILKWLKSPDMAKALEVIDRRVAELLSTNQHGAMAKLDDWFLSGDLNFNTITAERYILHYLRQHNPGLVEHLAGNGSDAHFVDPAGNIGIEITSLNAFFADWIVVERLTEFCRTHPFFHDKGLEITCSIQRVQTETQAGDTIYTYLEAVGKALLRQDHAALANLDLAIDYEGALPGYISWRYEDATTYPWFSQLTDKLEQKLRSSSKQRQFSRYTRNLVFVGVNHASPVNGIMPHIFAALGGEEGLYFQDLVDCLKNFWDASLPELGTVNGVCYFTYSLPQETPFYPLRMFWRPDVEPIPINL